MEIVLWILLAIGVLIILDRLLLWMEAKGWIYYRKIRSKSGAGGGALLGGNVFEPGARYLEEAREERQMEEEEDGDDDGKRKASDRVTG